MNLHLKLFLIGLLLFLRASLATAADYHSPRSLALGGAGHASPLLSDAIYLNPSFTSFIPVHNLSVNYLFFGSGKDTSPLGLGEYHGHIFNISVLDGTKDSLFQAGIGYTRREDVNIIHLGASKNIIEQLGVGLGSKFIFPHDRSNQRLIDGTFSITGIPTTWFQSAFIIDNIFEAAKDKRFYREFILGTKFNISSIFLIYFDPHIAPSVTELDKSFGYQIGAEWPFFTDMFIRVGYYSSSAIPHLEQRRGDGYGVGLGWLAPRLSLDYSFTHTIRPFGVNGHQIGFSVYF